MHALSPAKITSVTLKEDPEGKKIAVAEVPDDQFSLAIGKSGQNVRLASRLSGWSIDIVRTEQPVTEAVPVEEVKPEEVRAIHELPQQPSDDNKEINKENQ